jgi:lysophospholipase L1-like esterase
LLSAGSRLRFFICFHFHFNHTFFLYLYYALKIPTMKRNKLISLLIMFIVSGLFVNAQNSAPATEDPMRTDWANLARFQEDNQKVGLPAMGENRVVFMGNSITEGWSNAMPGFFTGKPYINRGISGQTTPQMLIRFRPDVVDLKPAVVVILAGINDIAGNTGPSTQKMIQDNLASMVEIARANGIRVVLSTVLPAWDFPWKPGIQPAEKVIALNTWIKTYAQANGCVYLDYFSPMVDERHGLKAEYTYDGVHPNLAGYQVMAPLAEKAIQQALKQ